MTSETRHVHFTCGHCGHVLYGETPVPEQFAINGMNCTVDFCPECKWSKHVLYEYEEHTGDEYETCGGMMEPIYDETGRVLLGHFCLGCEFVHVISDTQDIALDGQTAP